MAKGGVALLALVALGACGGSPAQPTSTPATPVQTGTLVARMTVQVDFAPIRDAVAGFSTVTVDASASTGPGALTFAIDFGDGSTFTTASGSHTYASPGTYTLTASVRDAWGRVESRSQSIVVKRFVGSWFHVKAHPAEVRRVHVINQDGETIRGVYSQTGAADQSFVGTLLPLRGVAIVAGATTLSGVIPDQFNSESEPWQLEVRTGGSGAEVLNFSAVIGEPTSPAPVASLRIRMDSYGSTLAIVSLTQVDFDASGSRGDGLTSFIDFGDGEFAAAARAVHVVERLSTGFIARATVVDRFGRTDTASMRYWTYALPGELWYFSGINEWLDFRFSHRSGVNYDCRMDYHSPDGVRRYDVPCSAVLSGERDIRIVVESLGLEFRGYLDLTTSFFSPANIFVAARLIVTQHGGPDDGRTWILKYHDPY